MSETRAEYEIPTAYHPPLVVEHTGIEWRCCECKTRLGVMVIYSMRGKLYRMPHQDGAQGPAWFYSLPCPRCGALNKRGAHEVRGVL